MAPASEYWQMSAKSKLEFILKYARLLEQTKNGVLRYKECRKFMDMIKRKEKLTIEDVAYIDDSYERVMKAIGLPSVPKTHDNVRRF